MRQLTWPTNESTDLANQWVNWIGQQTSQLNWLINESTELANQWFNWIGQPVSQLNWPTNESIYSSTWLECLTNRVSPQFMIIHSPLHCELFNSWCESFDSLCWVASLSFFSFKNQAPCCVVYISRISLSHLGRILLYPFSVAEIYWGNYTNCNTSFIRFTIRALLWTYGLEIMIETIW